MTNGIEVHGVSTSKTRTIGPAHPDYRGLTKTEARLLRSHQDGRICVESAHGKGPEGGDVSSGRREQAAGRKLAEKGFIQQVKHTTHVITNGGYNIHVTGNRYRVLTFLSE